MQSTIHFESLESASKARIGGLVCMASGALFLLNFLALSRLLASVPPPTASSIRCAVWCITALCLLGGPLGLIALRATQTKWRNNVARAGVVFCFLGVVSYIAGSIYIYTFPDRALRQFFTPGGSILLTIGMLLLATSLWQASRLIGWLELAPFATALYFPLQFVLQAMLFLGEGRGPSPVLLGTWGVFWLVLGYGIWSATRPALLQFIEAALRKRTEMTSSSETRKFLFALTALVIAAGAMILRGQSPSSSEGRRLFEQETFGGNGRTCLTCHSRETGTVSPQDAQRRFVANRFDPLFVHDGSDDGRGNGVRRMLTEATVLVEIPLPANVSLADDPTAKSVVLRRGIPSTLNTPALDPVLMLDGREPDLVTQAGNAIRNHAQHTRFVSDTELRRIAEFQLTDQFFSSPALRDFARGGPAPTLPPGRTESEKRGRLFFEDRPFTGANKDGACALCHSGPMLDRTNRFFPAPLPEGSRFQSVLVSELNAANNPVREFIFRNKDGSTTVVKSPDPGRALITGDAQSPFFDSLNAFKISPLRGVRRTAPYFHDNSARTLEDVMKHYARFFEIITTPPGGGKPAVILTPQDQADIVAYMKLLD